MLLSIFAQSTTRSVSARPERSRMEVEWLVSSNRHAVPRDA